MSALESQVRELSEQVRTTAQDAAAARVLAGRAERDATAAGQEQIATLLNTLIAAQPDDRAGER
ncbi:MAG TPA: hypothetical protein VD813_13650 [Pseudonocardia sp.]|nr:hypothetical protein [Pseudonocardia sp.]